MGSHGQTRREAYETACALAAEGKRPSAKAIRERLGGGGQQALLAGLNDWVDEAARRFQVPGIPEELRSAVVAFWDLACRHGEDLWAQQRQQLEARLAEEERALAGIRDERDAAAATVAEQADQIAQLREELQQAQDATQVAESELEARTQELRQRETALAEATSSRDELANRLDHEQRVAVAARESLEHAQSRIAALQAQHDVAAAKAEMLERAAAEAKSKTAETRADLERAQEQIDEHRLSLKDRDGQIGTLTAAVEREQQAREGDARHWMARIEELQASIAGHREREAQYIKDKRASSKAVGQLRDKLDSALAQLHSEREER